MYYNRNLANSVHAGMAAEMTTRPTRRAVLDFDIGMHVGALMGDGGLAEYATAKAYETFPLPEDCDSTVTAAVLMSALTVDLSLVERAHLNAGETVLVGGAGGAVELGVRMERVGHPAGLALADGGAENEA